MCKLIPSSSEGLDAVGVCCFLEKVQKWCGVCGLRASCVQ